MPEIMQATPKPKQQFLRTKSGRPAKALILINKGIVRANVHLYRRSGGKILGRFGKLDALLITTVGRKSGKVRTNPVGYLWDRGRFVICAAYGGESVNPAWYLNLRATSKATVEIGREKIEVTAEVLAPGAERDRLWRRLSDVFPSYTTFQNKTERILPVVVLTPTD
jgi:deazaflavin-dependent oxidoreductase (nitroreductase family)